MRGNQFDQNYFPVPKVCILKRQGISIDTCSDNVLVTLIHCHLLNEFFQGNNWVAISLHCSDRSAVLPHGMSILHVQLIDCKH